MDSLMLDSKAPDVFPTRGTGANWRSSRTPLAPSRACGPRASAHAASGSNDAGETRSRTPSPRRSASHQAILLDGRDPAEAFAEHPAWAGLVSLPQHVSYMRQVASYDPAAVWAEIDTPALLVAGGADFVTDPAEHELLRDVVQGGSGEASYLLLPDLDHFMNRVPDAQASFQAVSSGQPYQSFHAGLAEVIVDWLDAQTDR